MKRGTLLNSGPREDQKVFAAAGSADFSSVFSGCCPAAVS
jgi:hypothetical protein